MFFVTVFLLSGLGSSWGLPQNFEGKSRPDFQYPSDSVITHSYDVLHYDIDFSIESQFDSIEGNTTITSRAEQNIDSIDIHFGMNMFVDSILVNGDGASYLRIADTIYVNAPTTIFMGDTFTVQTFYAGKPSAGFFHGHGGFFTLSQVEEAAKKWFPCYEWCWDKADDGVTMHVEVPDSIYAVCNGLLTSIDTLSGDRLRFNWDHNHPIAAYLIAVSAYDYTMLVRLHNGYNIVYYALPGYVTQAQAMLDTLEIILSVYDTLIDTYPFADEKMGNYQISLPSGAYWCMEHQTCVLYSPWGFTNTNVHSHETGHMWWGDEVTCISYAQMFLNEGTTSYYESFPLLEIYGIQGFLNNIISQRESGLNYDDNYHYPIINSPDPFGTNVYDKGAWFHHMLRHLMGDTLYFPAMREYYQTYRGKNASVSELMSVMENFYGDSLGWFFHQWLEETDYPLLQAGWKHIGGDLYIFVFQVQTSGPSVFRIPIEFGIWEDDSMTVAGPYWMADSSNLEVVLTVKKPDSVTIDPLVKLYHRIYGIIPSNGVLLVDDDGTGNSQAQYLTAFNDLNISVLNWNVSQEGLPSDTLLYVTKAVFWVTGTRDNPLTSDRREKIRFALENGIPVAIFSPKTPSQLQGTAFLSDTLGFTYSGGTTSDTLFQGVTGDPIGKGWRWFNIPTHNSATLSPVAGSGTGCIHWNTGNFGVVRSDNFQSVFSSIDLQYIYNMQGYSTKMLLIANILNYFGIATPVAVEEIAETPVRISTTAIDVRYLPGTGIFLHAASPVRTDLSVYDITGREVMSWNFEGELEVRWTGLSNDGAVLPFGRYFAVLKEGGVQKQIIFLQ
ncbi:M1 family metallopeptidase [candidate division WOR-3 bacterium]|nr:M1 family metallopeptidase [candidate division WOR-3 bacterium]